ncbi:MAG: sulfite exporter TauE/SafE family protein [Rhodospirillales bacterium]|nr:sulfite exporter TauE/SafE family protein [Rhodospirillales bacterium]
MNGLEIDLPLAAELVAFCFATGAVAGLLAGLLGVGGGIVVVPSLFFVLGYAGVDASVRMQVAVATSLATIVPTSIISARAHRQRGSVDDGLLRGWVPAALAGAVLGTAFAASVKGPVLAAIFGTIALVVAFQMVAFPKGLSLRSELPGPAGSRAMAFLIGGFSSIMGIGGGTLAVPTLSLFSYPIRLAVGTASALGLYIAIPATVGMAIGGWTAKGLPPFSVGYVNLVACAVLLPTMLLCVKAGARIAHTISQPALRRVFGIVLAVVGLRMLSSVF